MGGADAGTGENSWLRGVRNVGGYAGDGSVGAFRSVKAVVDKWPTRSLVAVGESAAVCLLPFPVSETLEYHNHLTAATQLAAS